MKIKKIAFPIIAAFFTSAALIICNLYYFSDDVLNYKPDFIISIITALLIYFYINANSYSISKGKKTTIIILALIFSLLNIMFIEKHFYNPEFFTLFKRKFTAIMVIPIFIGYYFLFYYVQKTLCARVPLFNLSDETKDFNKRKFYILLLGIWTIYFIFIFPGIVQSDTVIMIGVAEGVFPLSNDHPFVQIALLWIFLKINSFIHNGKIIVMLMVCLQAGALAYLFAKIFEELHKHNFNKVLYYCLFVLIALPYNIINNASMIPLLFYIFKNYKSHFKKLISILLFIVILSLSYTHLLLPNLGIEKARTSSNMAVPLQQIARTLNKHGTDILTESERQNFAKVIDIEEISKKYMYYVSDPIKDRLKEDISKEELKDFYSSWRTLGRRYPKDYAESILYSGLTYFLPGHKERVSPIIYWNIERNIAFTNPYLALETINPLQKYMIAFTEILEKTPIIGFTMTCGTVIWVHIICLILILSSKQKKYYIISFVPLAYAIGLIFSPISAHFRYCVPILFYIPIDVLSAIKSYYKK